MKKYPKHVVNHFTIFTFPTALKKYANGDIHLIKENTILKITERTWEKLRQAKCLPTPDNVPEYAVMKKNDSTYYIPVECLSMHGQRLLKDQIKETQECQK